MFRLPARRLAALRPTSYRPSIRPASTYNLPSAPAHSTRPPPTHRAPDNYVDHEALHLLETKAVRSRRIVVAGIFLILGGTTGYYLYSTPPYQAEAPSTTPAFPSTPPTTYTKPSDHTNLITSGTSNVPPFPVTTHLEDGDYQLLGLGIRTVSFLSIEVYVVGFYVHTSDLAAVQTALLKHIHPSATAATPAEREQLAKLLMDPEQGEEVMAKVLAEAKFRSAFRVVPTRNTDFAHLRDGWMRGIQGRSQDEDGEGWAEALGAFKEVFRGQGKVKKGRTLVLRRDAAGELQIWCDPTGRNDGGFGGQGEEMEARQLGAIADERVSRYIWLMYLTGKVPSSPPMRASVIDGLCEMASRPAGTLETLPPTITA